MSRLAASAGAAVLACALSSVAAAQDEGASVSFSTSEGASTAAADGWMSTYTPEAGLLEFGLFAGLLFPASDHNLRDTAQPQQPFKSVAPDFGLRAAYFPVSFLGVEGEGAMMPTKTEDDASATLWALRAHVIGQVPGLRLTPFALIGAGRLGANTDAMGDDGDPALHLGIGVKLAVTKNFSVRLDGRDNITSAAPETRDGKSDDAHHPELLLGLSVVLGRTEAPPPAPKDSDGDGFFDPDDACPTEKGVAPDGCPIRDRDRDGFLDPDDKCPDEKGVAPDGCPVRDTDGDGFMDPDDKCPEEKGVAPDGCPIRDRDGDGILDDVDKCPTEPENKNGFEDEDGCPDELPEAVKKFTGVIQGIEFATNKDTIREVSFKTLDEAAKVLVDYPGLRVLITGHTDSDGTAEHNQDLSHRRAESVKKYLESKGVKEGRIETRGAGEDEPIADNKTRAGKQKNRRIEFKILER